MKVIAIVEDERLNELVKISRKEEYEVMFVFD